MMDLVAIFLEKPAPLMVLSGALIVANAANVRGLWIAEFGLTNWFYCLCRRRTLEADTSIIQIHHPTDHNTTKGAAEIEDRKLTTEGPASVKLNADVDYGKLQTSSLTPEIQRDGAGTPNLKLYSANAEEVKEESKEALQSSSCSSALKVRHSGT